jgi:hypothetical protein
MAARRGRGRWHARARLRAPDAALRRFPASS